MCAWSDLRVGSGLTRRDVMAAACATSLGLTSSFAADATFPSRVITLIVPYPPGGSNDIFARLISERLARKLKQPVVVDNKPGAGGLIGLGVLARALADGHTLALVSSSFATSAAVQRKLTFDAVKDFEPVARISANPLLLLASPRLGVRTMQDFLALARQRPGQVTYGSSGVGSVNHFAAELLADAAGLKMVHVPYKGMAPALTDLTGGHLDMVITSQASAHAFLVDGKVLVLATTGDARLASLLSVPTCREAGVPGFTLDAWAGFLVPAGLPGDRLTMLNAAINEAMASPEVAKALAAEGSTFHPVSASEFKQLVNQDLQRWRSIAKAKRIEAD